jgi:Mor family transcriptional regulator
MGYVNAGRVLPEELIKQIQNYVNGGFIYIPRKEGCQKAWGENSGARKSLKERNRQIYMEYIQGRTVLELVESYYLSEQSVRRIIYNEKKRNGFT